jgi:hypothetical protein
MADFHPRVEDLPGEFPVFPLPGALLLPRGKLPLNIFEPRYVAMTEAGPLPCRLPRTPVIVQ